MPSEGACVNYSKGFVNPYKLFVGSFVPNWIQRRKEISLGAKLCYGRLCQHAHPETGEAWPKLKTLAEELGVSERQVSDYIGELRNHNLIESRRPGQGRSNRYRFLFHDWMTSDLDQNKSSDQKRNDSSGLDRNNSSDPLIFEKNHLKEEEDGPPFEKLSNAKNDRSHTRTKADRLKDRTREILDMELEDPL